MGIQVEESLDAQVIDFVNAGIHAVSVLFELVQSIQRHGKPPKSSKS
jgi:hypothetical protein